LDAASPVASIVLSDPPVSVNLVHFTITDPTAEAYTVQTVKSGVQCRQIPEKKYAYFNVDDATIPSTQNNLIFYITFFAARLQGCRIAGVQRPDCQPGTGLFAFRSLLPVKTAAWACGLPEAIPAPGHRQDVSGQFPWPGRGKSSTKPV